ncbi:hypothetical protein [Corynebacterium sp. HMSC064E10]|uniref:hypothetical protein n=1 Tax=Corynebacterium sp. HMSC064E10 TaxID=1739364 RepID=UPI00114D0BC7|nr:hypothetical protein [Corynebacterium sp. HMSC064E10]
MTENPGHDDRGWDCTVIVTVQTGNCLIFDHGWRDRRELCRWATRLAGMALTPTVGTDGENPGQDDRAFSRR